MSVGPVSPRCAVAPYSTASRTPSHGSGGTGAAKRRSPTGACANGMPRNAAEAPGVPGVPRQKPRTRPGAIATTGASVDVIIGDPVRFGRGEQGEELRDDGSHVDVGFEHPLQLQSIGDSLEDASEGLGLDEVGDLAGRARTGELFREESAQIAAAIEEEAVGRMLGVS